MEKRALSKTNIVIDLKNTKGYVKEKKGETQISSSNKIERARGGFGGGPGN